MFHRAGGGTVSRDIGTSLWAEEPTVMSVYRDLGVSADSTAGGGGRGWRLRGWRGERCWGDLGWAGQDTPPEGAPEIMASASHPD